MTIDRKQILVSGGGIAGLTCALALARKGFRVEVFEQAEKIEAIGAGIQLSPNAIFVLSELGLMRKLQVVATAPENIFILDGKSGLEISRMTLGSKMVTRYGYPYYVIHRADLLQVLLAACRDEPNVTLHMGHKVTDLVQHQNGVTLFAAFGKGDGKEFTGAMLIGADGVWSKLRTNFLQLGKPVYSGLTAWRGMLRNDAVQRADINTIGAIADMENTNVWFHPGAHAVSYPVRSGQALNLVLIRPEEEPPRDLDGRFEMERLKPFDKTVQLTGWYDKWPGRLLEEGSWTRWPLFHAQPSRIRSEAWYHDNVILIGDAAHAMLPFAAQGAAMAIEDAHQLADCLSLYEDRHRAFLVYTIRRRDRVKKTVAMAAKNRSIYHMGLPTSLLRNMTMKMLGNNMLMMRQSWLYRWRGYTDDSHQ